ncbi:sensor histidine kinase [Sediminibacterium ginsengisoli]|uniref:histidine kinase n=1 Tax=Sediminibacterium ginsengisoli TaxID=413434 RepID=A0A1T4R3A7_9BACT|nr:HAMP domain-containing sensor histidine kinase [Sediminibacterium ginsengisoli]SKA10449.1 Signal transduction histidine kinase [Sediminibacterium ginsengisoli]
MKIKYRITLLFTIVVTAILLVVCVSVYYLSQLNREKDFRTRVRNRALTTGGLLFKVNGMDREMMRRIDEQMVITQQQKSVIVYNEQGQEIYHAVDVNATPVKADQEILDKVKKDGQYIFKRDGRDAVALIYKAGDGKAYLVVAAAYDRDGANRLSELKFVLILSFFTGILITVISGLFFSSGLVAPIKKITNEVKEISSQNLSRRIDVNEPKDELNELSSTFNALLTRLQESFEIQRRFIANASHELSTPLTSISSQLEITMQNERSAEEYKHVIDSVYDDVRTLTQLTRSLLELAKATGTSDGMELSLVRIDELLMRIPADIRKASKEYSTELHFDTFPDNEDNLLVFGNTDLLYSAIKNIVLNGCKYSDNHTAAISLNFAEDKLDIIVRDNGPGISEKDQQLIFQPFYRGSDVEGTHGSGLGLSLALRIINLHKGEIRIMESSRKGTAFQISLPIARTFHQI